MHRFSRIIHEKKSKCTYELTTIGVDTLTNMLLFETHAHTSLLYREFQSSLTDFTMPKKKLPSREHAGLHCSKVATTLRCQHRLSLASDLYCPVHSIDWNFS